MLFGTCIRTVGHGRKRQLVNSCNLVWYTGVTTLFIICIVVLHVAAALQTQTSMIRAVETQLEPDPSEAYGVSFGDLVFADLTTAAGATTSERREDLLMEMLAEVRSRPASFYRNLKLDSVDEAVRELESALPTTGGPCVVVDISTELSGRSLEGLLKIQSKIATKAAIVTGCVPDRGLSAVEDIVKNLEVKLKLGEELTGEAKTRVGCGFIGLLDASLVDPNTFGLWLQGAGRASASTGAPVLLTAQDPFGCKPWDQRLAEEAAEALLIAGAMLDRVVVCRCPCSHANEEDYVRLLSKGVMLSITFQGSTFYGHVGPDGECYPSDEEGARLVASLCRKGYARQLLLSYGVCCKLQLRKYGGHGYGHVLRNIVPRLSRLKVAVEDIDCMTRGNVIRLLSWWSPLEPVKPDVAMGECSVCRNPFPLIVGDFYSKFSYVYCSSKCLREHGKLGWKPLEA